MNDPIGDMLTRIRNAQSRGKNSVVTPASKLRARVLDVLQAEGYIRGYEQVTSAAGHPELRIERPAPSNGKIPCRKRFWLIIGRSLRRLGWRSWFRLGRVGRECTVCGGRVVSRWPSSGEPRRSALTA